MTSKMRWVGVALCVLFIIMILGGSAGNSSSRSFLTEIFSNQEPRNEDISLVTIEIVKPQQGHLYVFDREIAPIGFTLVLGSITIQVETSEDVEGIDIYIDDELRFSDYTVPYARLWNERTVGRHVITAIAHGGDESDEVSVFMVNLPKRRPRVVINEIMADAEGDDPGQEWIELYNAGESTRIKGWTVSNSEGTTIATLPNWVFPNHTYLVIHFGEGTNDDDFSDGNGTYYVGANQEIFENDMGECALYTGSPGSQSIVDFIAYCYDGEYEPGTAHGYATKAGIWIDGEYFDPMAEPVPHGAKIPFWGEGNSIGRDSYSNDTNAPEDWGITGGRDAFQATPGRCNLDAFGIVSVEMPSHLATASQDRKKWTVMVYMAADNGPKGDLEAALFKQLDELEKIGSDDNVNIVFQIDGWNNISEAFQDAAGKWRNRNDGGTFRGFLMKDKHKEYVEWDRTYVNTSSFVWAYTPTGESALIPEINTGKAAPLREFINWSIRHAPADSYILILNGHGAGWKGLLPDYTSRDMLSNMQDFLYMGELESALFKSAIRNVPAFSIIGFDCCLMANIEVAYQIRDWAQYMVASEEVSKNWAYEDIFGHLQKNPDISASDLATYMVNSYHKKHEKWNCHTLSAIDLGRLGPIYGGVRLLANHLKEGMEDWGDTKNQPFVTHGKPEDNCQIDVRKSLFAAEHYSDRNYVDLYHLVYLIGHNDGIYTGYKEPWQQILDGIEGIVGAVIANKHGASHPHSHGLSIYFPRHQTDHKNFNDCDGEGKTDRPFDNPWPSRYEDPADTPAIYAEDKTNEWGRVPYANPPPHPWRETPNFLWRDEGIHWDEFLHRYYKPCADAGEDITVEVECGEKAKITFDGRGSSSADDDGTIHEYYWDFDLGVNSDNGDWDKDGINEYNDDIDATGPTPTHEFSPGTYVVTLTVWDDHHTKNEPRCNDFPNEHWKTDQDSLVVTVIEKPCPDTEPPETTIIDPPDGAEFEEDNIMVSGLATDNVGIVEFGYHLEWDSGETNDAWEVDNLVSYEFTFTLALHPEWNEITVYARDAAGNEGSDSVTVYYYPPEEDTTPPVTIEEVGQPSWENGYVVTPGTPIWLNATDDLSGVNYIHYEIWWDSDGDGVIDTKMGENTAYVSSVEFCCADFEIYMEIAEVRFYAVDNAENTEEMKVKQHLVQGE